MKSFKITLALVALIFCKANLLAIDSEWSKRYDAGANDRGLHVTTEGGFEYLTGVSEFPGGSKIVTSTYDEIGTLLSLNVANTFLSSDNIKQIERDDAQAIYVLCQNSSSSFTLIKYNSIGRERWRKNYANFVVKFAIGNGSGLYISYLTSAGVSVRKLNRGSGSTDWTRNIADVNLLSNSENADMSIDINDNIYFGGTTTLSGSNYDYRIVKIKKNSTVIYNIRYSSAGARDEVVYKIVANDAGQLFVVGDYDNFIPVRTDFHVVKFSSVGAMLWATAYESSGGPSGFSPVDVQIGPDGNVVTVGNDIDFYNINPSGEVQRVKVSKFNSVTGALIFSVFPNAPDGDEDDLKEVAVCMTIDINNNIYFGGNSNVYAGISVPRNRYMIAKASGIDGHLQWVDASVGGVEEPANLVNDITVTAGEDVYVASSWHLGATVDMQISKYCQVDCFGLRMKKETISSIDFKVYPNPSSSSFTIKTNGNDKAIEIKVFDLDGKLIESRTETENEFTIGSDYSAGVYILNLQNDNFNETIRMIKTE